MIRNACYLDASLRSNAGHYANICRKITGELRRRGVEVDILANRSIETELMEELGAQPVFRHYPHARITGRKSINFRLAQASFLSDLSKATKGRQYDLVFVASVLPAQMAAAIRWIQTHFSAGSMPAVVVEFENPSGVGCIDGPGGYWRQFPDQYRSAAAGLSENYSSGFLFFAFDSSVSGDYSSLLGLEVEDLPNVQTGGEIRLRTASEQEPPVVGFLGHQRPEKGYHLVPDLLRLLLDRQVRAQFLIHNANTHDTETDRKLRELAAVDSRVSFEHQSVDENHWNRILDKTDIAVLPYEPNRYTASFSGIAVEAISSGLPVIGPNGTTMHALAERYQNHSIGFSDWTIESIADAIGEALQRFPRLSQSAYEGAGKWGHDNGAGEFVSRLLEFARERGATRPSPPTPPFDPLTRCLATIANAKLNLRESSTPRATTRTSWSVSR